MEPVPVLRLRPAFKVEEGVVGEFAPERRAIERVADTIEPSVHLHHLFAHPLPDERNMAKRARATIAETKGSHAVYVSKPKVVAEFIERPANQK